MTPEEYEKTKLQQFGQRSINNIEQLNTRLHEVKQNFYNRLESKKLIKKHGRIPFTEHMTITAGSAIENAAAAQSL